jgi:hypothetical protein
MEASNSKLKSFDITNSDIHDLIKVIFVAKLTVQILAIFFGDNQHFNHAGNNFNAIIHSLWQLLQRI